MTEEDYLEDEIFNNSGVNFQVGEDEREKIVFLQDKYPEEFGVMIKELTTFVKQYGDQRELQGRIDEIKQYTWVNVIQAARQLNEIEPLTWEAAHERGLTPMMADGRIYELEAKLKAKESEHGTVH